MVTSKDKEKKVIITGKFTRGWGEERKGDKLITWGGKTKKKSN